MSLLETLLRSMTSSSSLDTMSRRTGGSNDQMTALITAALPILLRALTENASSKSGAESLQQALTQHTETGSVAEQFEAADIDDGAKILQHILGQSFEGIERVNNLEVGMVVQKASDEFRIVFHGIVIGFLTKQITEVVRQRLP